MPVTSGETTLSAMSPAPNFADATFEPTDEQLEQLSREAFADVAKQHDEALARLRRHVAELRALALARSQQAR